MDLQDALNYFGLSTTTEVTMAELKTIYRRLAKEKHPDQGGSNTEFVNLRKAFVLLKNELEKAVPKNDKITVVNQELAELEKDELIAKYYKDTEKLNNQLELYQKSAVDQQIVLSNLKDRVQSLVQSFNLEKDNLQASVKQEIRDLEKKLNRETFWLKIFFFWPTISKTEFWAEYNNKIQYYTSLNNDLDANFFKEMLSTYGEGLNGLKDKIPEKK